MKKRVFYIAAALVLFGIFLYASRGPDISNALKRVILPELEAATGRKFIAQQIYINLFPLFAEIKGLKSFDDNGEKLLEARRVKGYIGLLGLLQRKLTVKRLVIRELDLKADREQIGEISANIQKYLSEKKKVPIKVDVETVSLENAALLYRSPDYTLAMNGLDADARLSKTPVFKLSSKEMVFDKKGLHEARGSLEAVFSLKDTLLELKKLRIVSHKSELGGSGLLGIKNLAGRVQSEATVYLDTIKKLFGLKRNGEGSLMVRGLLGFNGLKSGIDGLFVDLKVKGDLYLETLMELLNVKENINGHITVDGFVKGPLKMLHGEGDARLDQGGLFGVAIDTLKCKVLYQDGAMRFMNGDARLFGGKALAEGMIALPVVNYFEVKVKAEGVSSKKLFKLIHWDPMLPEGKVNGTLATTGSAFEPEGDFFYKSSMPGRDVLGRVKEASGAFSLKRNVLHFGQLSVATAQSRLSAWGTVDLSSRTLQFQGAGESADIEDLTAPYFTAVSGPVRYGYLLSGGFDNPGIALQFEAQRTTLATRKLPSAALVHNKEFIFDTVGGAVQYRKDLLTIKTFSANSAATSQHIGMSGTILFPHAASLFDFKEPEYHVALSAQNVAAKTLFDMFTDKLVVRGALNGDLLLASDHDVTSLSGEVRGKELMAGPYAIGSAEGHVAYAGGSLIVQSLRLRKGASEIRLSGTVVDPNDRFSLTATGQAVKLSDLVLQKDREKLKTQYKELFADNFFDTIVLSNLSIHGEGTSGNPLLSLQSGISAGAYRGRPVGSGDMQGTLAGKQATITARLLDKKLTIKGQVQLTGNLPWNASIELQPARYDFIAANFIKEVPDDLLINLRGSIVARGDKDHVNAVATINKAHLYLYGTGFTNSSGVVVRLDDKKLSIGSLSMKSETAEFKLSGSLLIGSGYDLLLEGSSSLSPLKVLSKNIDTIKGNASFVCSIAGDWNNPKLNGDMDITNGTLGFKNIRYRLSLVSAYLYFDEDRIVLDRASGKLSGGDVTATGTAYLQKFSIKRFLLNSRVTGFTASVSKDFWVNLDADLNYRGTLESQTVLGDVDIKRARYTERAEWKSWLLSARRKERPKVESTKLDTTNLNVRVTGANLVIDNNVTRAAVKMDVLLRGTLGQPVILGRVEAKEGIVYFRNNEFKILKTTIDFSNPNQIAPYFTIIAESKVKGYTIRLNLEGYVDQFNLSLSSDPVLAESDIFSLLTVGQLGKNIKGLEGGIGAGEATSFLTGKLQDVVEERLRTITGFDRLQIDPSVSKSTGTVSPRVTIAKRLMGDKLFVTYSTAVGTGAEQVWKLEYLLGRNTSLVGVRDEQGGLGGDVKFRFEFK